MKNGHTGTPEDSVARAGAVSYKILLVMIFMVSIILRVCVPDPGRTIIPGDETTYNYAALDMLKYGTLTREITGDMWTGKAPVSPTSWLSPGYPLYIYSVYWVAGHSTQLVLSSQIALSIFSFWLIYCLLAMLRLGRLSILSALAAAAVYPGFLYNIDRMLTEQLFITLFLAFSYAFLKAMEGRKVYLMALAGVLLGCATHVRAQAFPFALIVVFFCIVYETRSKRFIALNVGVFLGALLLVMAPWWIRNFITFHRFILFSEAGDGARIWGSVPYFIDMGSANGPLAEVVANNKLPNPEVYYRWRVFGFLQYMWGDVWDEHIVHPGWFLRSMCLIQPFVVVPTLVLTPLVILRRSSAVVFIAAVPLVFTLMNFPFHGLPRYVYPAIPFVFLMTGILIDSFTRNLNWNCSDSIGNAWQLFIDRWIRRAFVFAATAMSMLLFYSVYVFAFNEYKEMSSYRLSRYMNVRISDMKSDSLVQSISYDGADQTIENTHKKGKFLVNDVEGPAILKLDVPFSSVKNRVVTAVTMKMQGGFLFDYTTIYWTDRKTREISQNEVYRYPTSMFAKSRTVYIDGDVNQLMIVPYVFRGGQFIVKSIVVEKYLVPR